MAADRGAGNSTVLHILSVLDQGERYGYELIRELERRSEKVFQFQEGTLYPVLHRLENQGYVTAERKTGENGKERRYYRITPAGKKQLAAERESWARFSAAVNRVIGGEQHAFS